MENLRNKIKELINYNIYTDNPSIVKDKCEYADDHVIHGSIRARRYYIFAKNAYDILLKNNGKRR